MPQEAEAASNRERGGDTDRPKETENGPRRLEPAVQDCDVEDVPAVLAEQHAHLLRHVELRVLDEQLSVALEQILAHLHSDRAVDECVGTARAVPLCHQVAERPAAGVQTLRCKMEPNEQVRAKTTSVLKTHETGKDG